MAERSEQHADTAQEAPVANDRKKGMMRVLMMLLMIPLILFPAALGGWVAYSQADILTSVFGGGHSGEETAAAEEKAAEEEKKDEEEKGPAEYLPLENIIVNPAGTGGKRFLIVNLGLEVSSPEVSEEVKAKDIVVRDTLLKVLSARTVDELSDIGMRTAIRDDLQKSVNGVLKHGKVDKLYFTQYVLQ